MTHYLMRINESYCTIGIEEEKKENHSFKVFDGPSSKYTHNIPHGTKKLHYRGLVLQILLESTCSYMFYGTYGDDHGLRTPNEGKNQKYLKNWVDVADKICFGRT